MAILTDQNLKYVWTVNAGKVARRNIKLGNVPEGGDIQGAQVSLSFAVAQTAQGLEQPPS